MPFAAFQAMPAIKGVGAAEKYRLQVRLYARNPSEIKNIVMWTHVSSPKRLATSAWLTLTRM